MPFRNEATVAGEEEASGLSLDTFWAVYPPVLERLANAIATQRPLVSAGPVTDAARAGIPIRNLGGVAVVPIRGPLQKRRTWLSELFGGTGYLAVKAAVNAAVADTKIEEILLLIDSPGGSVLGVDDLAQNVRAARERKPITAYIDGMGASAAYYIASQATEVHIGRTDLVGSIGAIMVLYDTSALAKKEGVKPVVIDTGKFKHTGVAGVEITDEEIAELRRVVDFYGAAFEAAVVQGRRMDPKAVHELADGRIWPGEEALGLGLVDRISTFEETLGDLQGRVRRRGAVRTARARTAAMRR